MHWPERRHRDLLRPRWRCVVARAVVQVFKGCISDVLVYKEANRRKGIASALYALIEADLGRPLRPSRIRSRVNGALRVTKPGKCNNWLRSSGTCLVQIGCPPDGEAPARRAKSAWQGAFFSLIGDCPLSG